MPDFNNLETIETIKEKSSVLYLGCDLKQWFFLHLENQRERSQEA